MMTQQPVQIRLLINDARLQSLDDMLDTLHTAASEGALHSVTPLTQVELIGWLYDLIYVAQETILEMQQASAGEPELKRVK